MQSGISDTAANRKLFHKAGDYAKRKRAACIAAAGAAHSTIITNIEYIRRTSDRRAFRL